MSEEQKESWAIVALMGHKTLAGRLSEEERFGAKLGRIDIPGEGDTFATVYFGGSSVYSINVVTEEVARAKAVECQPRPVYTYRVPEGEQLERPAKSITSRSRDFEDSFIDEDDSEDRSQREEDYT